MEKRVKTVEIRSVSLLIFITETFFVSLLQRNTYDNRTKRYTFLAGLFLSFFVSMKTPKIL